MTALKFILASLRHYRRIHLSVALGVAVATAVLTGALLVGDSVRGSLRDLTIERLGRIDSALVTANFFRTGLADELIADASFKQDFDAAEPAILITGTLQSGSGKNVRRATYVSIVGCTPQFWSFGDDNPAPPLSGDEIAITASLAHELSVQVGDDLLLRLPIAGAIPADSPLGEKSDTSTARRLRIAAVLPPQGLARFSLMPSQHEPRNAFVPLATMQALLKKPGRANAIFVATKERSSSSSEEAQRALHPRLEDYGLHIEKVSVAVPYIEISSDELVLPDSAVRAAEKAFGREKLQPVSTYLANTIASGAGDSKRRIPYSTIAGVDSTSGIGPILDESGQPIELAVDEIALNQWAADDLQAKLGDPITVTFYQPESTHGVLRERSPPPVFTLKAIVPLETPDGKPTAAADPKLTPEMPGVTDQPSIRDWDLPFELVETIRPSDEDYWDKFRTTPKAFISLTAAKRLWPSRWGTVSLLRLPTSEAGLTAESAATKLAESIDPSDLGMMFLPVKQLGLAASSGTTPFDGLFLGFSFFLIAAALMLIALLFRLGVESRARELGTLAAAGFGKGQISKLLSREGLFVAVVGASAGVVYGVLYAWLMVFGLRTWWLAAISTPFLTLHVNWPSLLFGWLAGVSLSWITIRLSIRKLLRTPAARLLTGVTESAGPRAIKSGWLAGVWPKARLALAAAIIALVCLGFKLAGESQAGAFFASGAVVLILLLGEVRYRLQRASQKPTTTSEFRLPQLSLLNASRNPGRSTLTIGLVAAASFLIVAISAFRLETGDAGTGGFDFTAKSDLPIHYDLNTPEGRIELGFSDAASRALDDWRVFSLRVAAGEDASCLNLYRPTQPRVLGVPSELIDRGGFAWSATSKDNSATPWKALSSSLGRDAHGEALVPVVLDASTAIYSLHLKGVGSQLIIRDGADKPVTLQVVGMLQNSVLQGNLLVSESNFVRLFPEISGHRFFLIERKDLPRGPSDAVQRDGGNRAGDSGQDVASALETALANEGFDVADAREQLASFLAVQNTYLSTFQSLGALGLLLGTVGLAVAQLRSVLERRGELAVMRAGGFPRRRLVQMVIWENAVLLIGGLAVGVIAAAVALVPQWAPQAHSASVPWGTLAALLGLIAFTGLAAAWLATHSALRAPLLAALRGD